MPSLTRPARPGRPPTVAPVVSRRRGRPRSPHLLYALPAAVALALLSVYPLVQLVRMSVSAVNASTLNGAWELVGLDNYLAGWEQGVTQAALGRTLLYVLVVTVVGIGGGVGAAIAMRASTRPVAFLLGLMVFVWALPPVVNGSVWKFLFADKGLLNALVDLVGAGPVPFLYDQDLALLSVAFVNSWALVPFNVLVYRAAILNIPEETFEAAALDGASAWQGIRHVLLPSLRPTTLVLLVLTVVNAFRSFDFIYVMTKGGPGTATTTLPFQSYLQAFVQYDFGAGSATAVVAVVLVALLAVVYARGVVKEENA